MLDWNSAFRAAPWRSSVMVESRIVHNWEHSWVFYCYGCSIINLPNQLLIPKALLTIIRWHFFFLCVTRDPRCIGQIDYCTQIALGRNISVGPQKIETGLYQYMLVVQWCCLSSRNYIWLWRDKLIPLLVIKIHEKTSGDFSVLLKSMSGLFCVGKAFKTVLWCRSGRRLFRINFYFAFVILSFTWT